MIGSAVRPTDLGDQAEQRLAIVYQYSCSAEPNSASQNPSAYIDFIETYSVSDESDMTVNCNIKQR